MGFVIVVYGSQNKKVTTLRNLERVRLLRVPRGLLGRAARPPALDLREEVLPFHLSPDVEVGHSHHPDEHADNYEPRQCPSLEAAWNLYQPGNQTVRQTNAPRNFMYAESSHVARHIPIVGLINGPFESASATARAEHLVGIQSARGKLVAMTASPRNGHRV